MNKIIMLMEIMVYLLCKMVEYYAMLSQPCYYLHGVGGEYGAVVGAGEIHNKAHVCIDRRLNDFALVFVIKGDGWFSHAGGPRKNIAAGEVLLLFPGIEHSYGPQGGATWSEYWLMFRGDLFTTMQRHGRLDVQRPSFKVGLQPNIVAEFSALIAARVWAAQRQRTPLEAQAEEGELAARVVLLLARLQQLSLTSEARAPQWLDQACTRLSADLQLPLDVSRVAAGVGFTYERFRKSFTAAMGIPPAHFRLLRRIEQAKTILMSGADIAQTAEKLGFCDVYFFSRQFKSVTGTTPARFRGAAPQRTG